MGRLFQYNRLGEKLSSGGQEDVTKTNETGKPDLCCSRLPTKSMIYPSYMELYSEYYDAMTAATDTDNGQGHLPSHKFKILHQWLGENGWTRNGSNDGQRAKRKPRVYDCMKGLLMGRLFHHNANANVNANVSSSDDDEILRQPNSSPNRSEDNPTRRDHDACDNNDRECHSRKFAQCRSDDESTDSDAEASDDGALDCNRLIAECSPRRKRSKIFKTSTSKHSAAASTATNNNNNNNNDLSELLELSWYHPGMSMQAAIDHLQRSPPGSFLVRRKVRSGAVFELFLRVETKVKNYSVIASTKDRKYKLKGAKKQFSSLKALITHHSVMAEQLPITLNLTRDEIEKMSMYAPKRCADDFDTYESLQIYDILQSLQTKSVENS